MEWVGPFASIANAVCLVVAAPVVVGWVRHWLRRDVARWQYWAHTTLLPWYASANALDAVGEALEAKYVSMGVSIACAVLALHVGCPDCGKDDDGPKRAKAPKREPIRPVLVPSQLT